MAVHLCTIARPCSCQAGHQPLLLLPQHYHRVRLQSYYTSDVITANCVFPHVDVEDLSDDEQEAAANDIEGN